MTATPRPWRLHDMEFATIVRRRPTDSVSIADCNGSSLHREECSANADLIVRAVNTFSEREALLREAADFIEDTPLESPSGATSKIQAELIARIRTALGEKETKE